MKREISIFWGVVKLVLGLYIINVSFSFVPSFMFFSESTHSLILLIAGVVFASQALWTFFFEKEKSIYDKFKR